MDQIMQRVMEELQTLPADKQREVLDFVELLKTRMLRQEPLEQWEEPVSALVAAGDLVGCLDGGPPDLSTNQKYLEGFGES